MMSLAYILGLDSDDNNQNGYGNNNFDYANGNYQADADADADAEAEVQDCGLDRISQYTMAFDSKLAAHAGIDNRCQYTQFYELTYDLAKNGGCTDNQYDANWNGQDQDMYDNQDTYDNQDDVENEANVETIKQNFVNCYDSYAAIGVDIESLDMDGKYR